MTDDNRTGVAPDRKLLETIRLRHDEAGGWLPLQRESGISRHILRDVCSGRQERVHPATLYRMREYFAGALGGMRVRRDEVKGLESAPAVPVKSDRLPEARPVKTVVSGTLENAAFLRNASVTITRIPSTRKFGNVKITIEGEWCDAQ